MNATTKEWMHPRAGLYVSERVNGKIARVRYEASLTPKMSGSWFLTVGGVPTLMMFKTATEAMIVAERLMGAVS